MELKLHRAVNLEVITPVENITIEDQRQTYILQRNEKKTSTLPLADYIRFALEEAAEEWVTYEYPEEWKSPLWDFAKIAKGHPDLIDEDGEAALRAIDAILGADWPNRFDIGDIEEERIKFVDSWDSILCPAGWSPIDRACQNAVEAPFAPRQQFSDMYVRFVSIAGHLQLCVGEGPILLPVKKISEVLGCSRMTVSRLRSIAIRGGLLTEIAKSEFTPGSARRRATKFRFAIDRFNTDNVEVERVP